MSAKLAAAKYPLTFRLPPPPSQVSRLRTSNPNPPPAAPRAATTTKGAPPAATAPPGAGGPPAGAWQRWSPAAAAAAAPCRAIRSIWHGPDAWPRRRRDEVKKKRSPGDLRCHCATTVPAAAEAQQEQQQQREEEQMLVARIVCAGDTADQLVEGLLSFGASSCAIEDANVDTPDEQKIFSRGPLPWQSGHRQLWDESQILAYFPADQDVGEALAMAAESAGLKSMPSYKVEKVEEANWVQQVQDMFVPVEVAPGLYIVPKWCTPPNAWATNVILEPGLAFGTGDHPTTRLCLRWLHAAVRRGDRVLDYGTGSGVLALAALKLGAARAVGVDTDPVAVSSARHNGSLNSLPHNGAAAFQVVLCDDSGPDGADPVPDGAGQFDVVVANILVNPLTALAARIAGYARPGGLVGLSGVLDSQVEQLKEAYCGWLEELVVSEDNGWAMLQGRKKKLVDI